MDAVQLFLVIILLVGGAAVTYFWSSAKAKPRSSRPVIISSRSNIKKLLDTDHTRSRQPLEVVYTSSQDTEVDIIAVHGLGSDVDWSWVYQDGDRHIHWLRDPDMLPAKVPGARIIVYNYQSNWASDAPRTRLEICGEELIHSIHSFRRRDSTNHPLILIGHSLGGSVIEHALLYAENDETYQYLPAMTVGLVFLGTPFRGSKWQPWADRIAKYMERSGSHRGITKDIAFDNPALLDSLHKFCRLLNTLSTPVSCFGELYETDCGKRMGLSGVVKGMVVEESSACIPGFDRHLLQADHFKMNKYSGPTDRSYLSVSEKILDMCSAARNVIRRRKHRKTIITDSSYALSQKPESGNCLRDLFETDPADDKNALKRKKGSRAGSTCEWILGTEALTTWLRSETEEAQGAASPVLWLHGNPGTGKSTMALYLAEELSTNFASTDSKTLAYFFCDSAFDTRRTATSIVRGLLLQLVQQHPQLLNYILPKYHERGSQLFTSFDSIWAMFIAAAADQHTGQKYCIIDALDECTLESQTTLLRQFEETFLKGECPQSLRILVTSRPYPEIRQYLEQFTSNDLAAFPEQQTDIRQYIKEKLDDITKKKQYTPKVKNEVAKILRQRSEGTFLWISLACEELEKKPSVNAIATLESMPIGLHALYKQLLETALRNNESSKGLIQRILACVAVCFSPLTVAELSDACQLYQDQEDAEKFQFTQDLIASCRLMVVIQDEHVQLLHKSVRDFLIAEDDTSIFKEREAHAQLAYNCLDYLKRDYSDKLLPHHGFSWYAVNQWPHHARNAQAKFKVKDCHADFFAPNSQSRAHWVEFVRFLSLKDTRLYILDSKSFSALHTAGLWGILPLIDHHIANCSRQDRAEDPAYKSVDLDTISNGKTALRLAIDAKYPEAVHKLLSLGARLSQWDVKAAARSGDKQIIASLLTQRCDTVSVTQEVIEAAAEAGNIEVIELLFNQLGEQKDVTEEMAFLAALDDHAELMAYFLDQLGATKAITPMVIWVAAIHGRKEMMELLIDRLGGDIITHDVVKSAVENEHHAVALMKLLLDRLGGDIITYDVVKSAVENEHHAVALMKLLFDQRENRITITEEVLISAVSRNDGGKLMEMLLDRRVGELIISTAVLTEAAKNFMGGRAIIKLLFHWKQNEIRFIEESTMNAAARNGDDEIIKLLLNSRCETTVTETVLSAAVGHSTPAVVDLLLKKFDETRIIDENLLEAAARNTQACGDMMRLLLDRQTGSLPVTEKVWKAAVSYAGIFIPRSKYNRASAKTAFNVLLEFTGDKVAVTEGMLKVAVGSRFCSPKTIEGLLARCDELPISEQIFLQAAGENETRALEILFKWCGDGAHTTERVLDVAAANRRNGPKMMKLLLDCVGAGVKVTEGVVEAAATNELQGAGVLRVLVQRRIRETVASITEKVLAVAGRNGNVEFLDLVCQYTSISIKDEWYRLAKLFEAARLGDVLSVEKLVNEGATPDTKNVREETPLWIAAKNGNDEVVELLVQRGDVSIDSPSSDGSSPLLAAVYGNKERAVATLAKAGANPHLANSNGKTPFTVAKRFERFHKKTVTILEWYSRGGREITDNHPL